jgi:hypothetical protein
MIENLELLRGLPVVSGSQNLVRYFPFVPNYFLQRKSMSIQLPRKMQQLLRIQGIRRSFFGKLCLTRMREGTSLGFHTLLLSSITLGSHDDPVMISK